MSTNSKTLSLINLYRDKERIPAPYIMFCNDNRENVKQMVGENFSTLGLSLGTIWFNMTNDEKYPYIKSYELIAKLNNFEISISEIETELLH